MKSVIASMVAVAGLSVAASGVVNTRMEIRLSTDGTTFLPAGSTLNVNPGQTVQVQVRVTYTGAAFQTRNVVVNDAGDPDNGIPPSSHTEDHRFVPKGFSSLNFQPTVSNVTSSDVPTAFANGGAGSNTSSPSGAVGNTAGSYGRISPYARTALTGLTSFVQTNPGDGLTYLRVAQPNASNWIGGAGNTSGGSGVNLAQLASVGRTASDPAFAGGGTPNATGGATFANVFRFGIQINGSAARPDLFVDAPLAGFGNLADPNNNASDREVYWWAMDSTAAGGDSPANPVPFINEQTGSFRGTTLVVGSTIHMIPVPTPATLALLGLGGLVIGRRRR